MVWDMERSREKEFVCETNGRKGGRGTRDTKRRQV
jgi:hypothetical protein